MTAAHMCRAYTRLEPSIFPSWSRRAVFLEYRPSHARLPTIATRHYCATAPSLSESPSPSLPDTQIATGGRLVISRSGISIGSKDKPKLEPNVRPIAFQRDPEVIKRRNRRANAIASPYTERKPRRHEENAPAHHSRFIRARSPPSSAPVVPLLESAPERAPEPESTSEPPHAAEQHRNHSNRNPKLAKKLHRPYRLRNWPEKVQWQQWGYIRHQHRGAELAKASKEFLSWKGKLHHADKTPLEDIPWRFHGEFLSKYEDEAKMRDKWESLESQVQAQQWPLIILSTLIRRPHKIIRVMSATLNPLPPGYAIADTMLHYLGKLKPREEGYFRDDTPDAEAIVELMTRLLLEVPENHVPWRQSTLGLLARNLPVKQVAEIYQVLLESGLKLHANTQLQYASALAQRAVYKDAAFQILKTLTTEGLDLNQRKVTSVITTLLHHREKDETSTKTFSPERAMEFFLENGLAPNLSNFTALVDSLCKKGDMAEAIRLPLLLAENGAIIDKRCYQVVFRGAKHSLEASNIREAYQVAKVAQLTPVEVLNNTLHSVYYFACMESRDKRHHSSKGLPLFRPMLSLYSKKFDLNPLQWLVPDILPLVLESQGSSGPAKFTYGAEGKWDFMSTIVPVAEEPFNEILTPGHQPHKEPYPRQLQPDSTTLATMLRAYIKSLRTPYDIMTFYSFFKHKLEDRDTAKNWALDIIREQGSLIHDTLLLTMMGHKSLLRPALQVFGDMMRGSQRIENSGEGNDGAARTIDVPVHPAPSLFTFNIMIDWLFTRGERPLAEQFLKVMYEQELVPNDVTWNTLVKGYASTQNMSRTVGALQDLEAAGFKPDEFTFRAFGRLKNQDRALQMMQDIIDANMQRLEQSQSQ